MLANALLPRHLEGERVQADAPTVAGYCPDAVFEPPNCACVELEKDAGMWVTDNALGVAHAILPEHSAFVFHFRRQPYSSRKPPVCVVCPRSIRLTFEKHITTPFDEMHSPCLPG